MAKQQKGWVSQLGSDSFSLRESIGGWRGALESLLPGLIFVVSYVMTQNLTLTLVLSGGIALVFVVVRLFQHTGLTQAFTGLLGVGVGVLWAALSGQAENYFAWGLIANAASLLLFLISLLVRKSAVSLLIQFFYGLPSGWKKMATGTLLVRRSVAATWVWVTVFAVRLAGQTPLYCGGHVVALGTVKLLLGLPLFAIGGWITWILLRGVLPTVVQELKQSDTTDSHVDSHDIQVGTGC